MSSVFRIRNLSVLSYAQGFTLWHYRANVATLSADKIDAVGITEVSAPGFFECDMLASGDIILVSCRDGALQLYVSAIRDGKAITSTMLQCFTGDK